MAWKFYQGYYKPKNPKKYKGKDVNNIVYRSSLELKVMMYLDNHKDVIFWGSEEFIIQYISPKDNKIHRYYPDFIVKLKNTKNKEEIVMIEVKPQSQIDPPKLTKDKKPNKRQINEMITFSVNTAKWEAAKQFCKENGWRFELLNESDISKL